MWGVVPLDDIAYDNAAIVIFFLVFGFLSHHGYITGAIICKSFLTASSFSFARVSYLKRSKGGRRPTERSVFNFFCHIGYFKEF